MMSQTQGYVCLTVGSGEGISGASGYCRLSYGGKGAGSDKVGNLASGACRHKVSFVGTEGARKGKKRMKKGKKEKKTMKIMKE